MPPSLSTTPGRKRGWFSRLPNRQFLHWARQQLHIQPYQHLLEVGYGAGHLTEEVASALRIGFIAGIESSIPLYQQAYTCSHSRLTRITIWLSQGSKPKLPLHNL